MVAGVNSDVDVEADMLTFLRVLMRMGEKNNNAKISVKENLSRL